MADDTPSFQQKILFGCPGTGKSHKVETEILKKSLKIEENSDNVIKCVFHPEYTYGDFMGKLMPLTQGDKVTYRFYPGHFLRALAQAYNNLIHQEGDKPKHVALVIDEINRGNTAAIFGSVIQLLDREDTGYSSYHINLSDIEYIALTNAIWDEKKHFTEEKKNELVTAHGATQTTKFLVALTADERKERIEQQEDNPLWSKQTPDIVRANLAKKRIILPPNFSIIGTMNTSDESIYYMDSAFKRRWDWEYVDLTTKGDETKDNETKDDESPVGNWKPGEGDAAPEWYAFVDKLNQFIKGQAESIRRVEDKQIGYWFIKAKENIITEDQIKNKLMFFLWDSVFQRDKSPFEKLLGIDKGSLVTFGDFTGKCDDFIEAINKYKK